MSSQSWKRAIREFAQEGYKAYYGGQRTRLIIAEIRKALIQKDCEEQRAHALAMCLGHYLAKIDPKHVDKVKTLMFLSPEEYNKLAQALLALDEDKIHSLIEAFSNFDTAALENESDEETEEEVETDSEEKPKSKKKKTDTGEKKLSPKEFSKKINAILKTLIGAVFRGKNAVQVKDAADIALLDVW